MHDQVKNIGPWWNTDKVMDFLGHRFRVDDYYRLTYLNNNGVAYQFTEGELYSTNPIAPYIGAYTGNLLDNTKLAYAGPLVAFAINMDTIGATVTFDYPQSFVDAGFPATDEIITLGVVNPNWTFLDNFTDSGVNFAVYIIPAGTAISASGGAFDYWKIIGGSGYGLLAHNSSVGSSVDFMYFEPNVYRFAVVNPTNHCDIQPVIVDQKGKVSILVTSNWVTNTSPFQLIAPTLYSFLWTTAGSIAGTILPALEEFGKQFTPTFSARGMNDTITITIL